jgi:biotin carboxyl carrier protein
MRRYTITVNGKEHVIDVDELPGESYRVLVEGQEYEVRLVDRQDVAEGEDGVASGEKQAGAAQPDQEVASAPEKTGQEPVRSPSPSQFQPGEHKQYAELTAPMPGTILSVEVATGETIQCGQTIIILEAMKMKNSLQSPQDGVVAAVYVQPGQHVNMGDMLIAVSGQNETD